MKEIKGQQLIFNGFLVPVENFQVELLASGTTIYEVMRLINGKPLFLDDHLDRLQNSIGIKSLSFDTDRISIRKYIQELVDANKMETGNIKLIIHFANKASKPAFMMYFIFHYYPTPADYKKGVETTLFKAERNNPNAKIVNLQLRQTIENLLKEQHLYEAILVNRKNEITEGNKSNLFFIKDQTIVTPPEQDILPGITRKYVFRLCMQKGIPVFEQKIPLAGINAFDSVFLTGTSPKILPIASIDNFTFKVNNTILEYLKQEYDMLIYENIQNQ